MGSSSGITFSGLSSGLDTSAIVDALVNASKAPIYRLQRQKSNLGIHKSTYSSIEGMIDALETKAKDLDTTKEFFAYSASSSDTTKATVAADGDAVPGRYSMTISTLASAERTYTDSLGSSATSALMISGALGITVGSETAVEVEIQAGDTATTIASKINASGADVTAGLLFDGTNYYVQVSGNQTGVANAITFDESRLLQEENVLNFVREENEKQAATDAAINIDGFNYLENIINNKFSRLKYFDRLMCQNEEQSLKDLIIFNKTIKQRNAALEKKDKNIKIWDKQLNESAQRVWKNRKTFFTKIKEKINIEMPQYYVNYKSTKPINYLDQLTKNITIDLLKQKTTQGPHKDKIEITFNKQDLKDTGSQGEKKLFTSTLKHIESNLKKSPKPIILLDDFFAKLDKKNIIKTLLKHTNKNQTIITTTDTTNINKEIEEIQRQNQTKAIKIIKL